MPLDISNNKEYPFSNKKIVQCMAELCKFVIARLIFRIFMENKELKTFMRLPCIMFSLC